MPTKSVPYETRNAAGDVIASGTREVDTTYRVLTPFEFWNLLSLDQKTAVLAARDSSPLMSVWWEDYKAASQFERDHPSTAQGLDVLVYEEVLTSREAAAILASWPTV